MATFMSETGSHMLPRVARGEATGLAVSGARQVLVDLAIDGSPLASPIEAYFEVANRCNSKCATCPLTFSPQESARQLSLDEFKSLVAQLPDLRRAVMQGIGEPLLNRELAPMIRHLKERGVYVVFNTNAALLTRRRQVELIESGLDELRVSLDGSTPETYLRVRGIPAFDRVVHNVSEMVQTKRTLGAATPRLSFWVTGLRENLPELPGVIDLAAQIGVDEVYLQRMVFGFGKDALANAEQSIYAGYREEAESIIADAERRAAASGVSFRGADALSPRESILEREPQEEPWRACSRPLRLAYITAQGNALPCCIAPFTDAPYASITLGNYLQDGVQAVWTGDAYRSFRERLYSSEPPAACRNCGLAWSL
jgi:MoaA/NifB/PqqE/SkfB family radical SAM enzyme